MVHMSRYPNPPFGFTVHIEVGAASAEVSRELPVAGTCETAF